jgi:hypothetical protein
MHSSGISIWFFIGVLLTIYGAMILGYGLYELVHRQWPTWCWPTCTRLSGGVRCCWRSACFTACAFAPAATTCKALSIRCRKRSRSKFVTRSKKNGSATNHDFWNCGRQSRIFP